MSAGEALMMALAAHDAGGWSAAARLWRSRLAAEKRVAHALAALTACEPGDARDLLSAVESGAGAPVARFDAWMAEASFWADMAADGELKAYSVACYLRMSPRDRSAFLEWAEGRAAA